MPSLPACWVGLHSPSTTDDAWLGAWAQSFTPLVARLHGVWVLDVTRSLRLWGGVPGLLHRLQAGCAASASHPEVRWALGPSPWAARARVWLQISEPEDAPMPAASAQPFEWQSTASLARLPLTVLPDLATHCPVWARLGVTTWGQLDGLPRAGVVRRWGAAVLHVLDQAMGRRPCPLAWLPPPDGFAHTLELTHCAEHAAALAQPMAHLLALLHDWLVPRQLGVWVLRWQLHHDTRRDGPPVHEWLMHLSQPMQTPDGLQRLSMERLQQQSWVAPVVRLGLQVLQTQPWREALGGDLFHPAHQPEAQAHTHAHQARLQHTWAGLLDQLRARLGDGAVQQWRSQNSPLTEASQVAVQHGALHDGKAVAALSPWASTMPTWLALPPRPLVLRGGLPQFQGPLRLLSASHTVEWLPWADASATARVRDHHLAHSPGAGLVWVCRERSGGDAPTWWLMGWWA